MPVQAIGLEGIAATTIAHVPSLRHVYLAWNPVRDDSLGAIATLRLLETLDLSNCPYVSHSGLLQVVHLRHVRVLRLANTCITDATLDVIAECFAITLEVGGCGGGTDSVTVHCC